MAYITPNSRRALSTTKAAVFIFFLSFFILVSSGRIGSANTNLQTVTSAPDLQTASGNAHDAHAKPWMRLPDGHYFQPHDMGAVLLVWPGTWLGARVEQSALATMLPDPSIVARLAVSLTYIVVSAIGCLYLFLLFNEFYSDKQAFVVALAFAAGSLYLPYAKMIWDEAPCAAAMCALLFYTQALLRPAAGTRAFAAAGAALALVCLLHHSIAPPLFVAMLILAVYTRGPLLRYLVLAGVFAAIVAPMWAFDVAYTRSMFRPFLELASFVHGAVTNSTANDAAGSVMHGDMLQGLGTLLFSANRGLVVFSPIVLTSLFLPWTWPRLSSPQRALLVAMLFGLSLYVGMVIRMQQWGAIGWGPRCLLPCLPIVFLMVGPCLLEIARRSNRTATLIVIAAIGFNVAPTLIDWHAMASGYAGTQLQDANSPHVIEDIWSGFFKGMRGEPLGLAHSSTALTQHDDAGRFPDVWTAQMMKGSSAGRMAGWSILCMLLLGMTMMWGKIFAARRQRDGLTEATMRAIMQQSETARRWDGR
ncbi:hypothetical protein [Paraburkholderia sp. DHOC27]|uniref:hypothetical protein n=1 Tax=Paraburkholderia sp. DHOC27 TaxID=2303330 RepID=UPI000E3DC499|nr:hypothetical protein [Paraburkholderia sp. DHOC27]RFU47922.1 hypothetical protein D0B32_10350 [Paraburkholderia sp. DHOC27]